MEKFWEFVSEVAKKIPGDIGADAPDKININLPEELPAPKRLKFVMDKGRSSEMAYKTLAAYFNNLGDVANLADLAGFPEVATVGYVDDHLSYFT